MKYIVLTAFLYISFAMCIADAKKPIQYAAPGGSGSFKSKSQCERVEGETCYRHDQCPIDECSPTEVQEPDGEEAVLQSEEPCRDETECRALIEPDDFCSDPAHLKAWGDRDEDGSLEAWCYTMEPAFKTVMRLRPDQAKLDAKAAREAQRAADRKAKQDARGRVRNCTDSQLSNQEIIACINDLAKVLE